MATADSIIRVSIIADAQKLQKGFKDADKATGGFLGSAAKVAGGVLAIDKGFELIGDALGKADAVGDAMSRLEFTIGKVNADKLHDMAFDFEHIGLAAPDVLALEGAFAGIGTAIGLNKDDIANFADDVITIADKLSDQDPAGRDAAFFVDAIGKAAGGATKPLKDLNIAVDENAVVQRAMHDSGKDNPKLLTDSEKAAARFHIIMEKLNPVLDDATKGTQDLGDKQATLRAKFDNAMTRIGEGLQGPLADLLTFFADELDAIDNAIDGWKSFGKVIEETAGEMVTPLGKVRDLIQDIKSGIAFISGNPVIPPGGAIPVTGFGRKPATSESGTKQAVTRFDERRGYKAFIP